MSARGVVVGFPRRGRRGTERPQSPESALIGEAGLTGDGADFGEADFTVGFGFGLAGLLADTGVFALTAVGAVLVVSVGLLGVGDADGVAVGEAGAVAPMTMAGCGSALAGSPELIAMIPRVQVPTPRVPETAQAIADLDSGMASLLRRPVCPPTGSG